MIRQQDRGLCLDVAAARKLSSSGKEGTFPRCSTSGGGGDAGVSTGGGGVAGVSIGGGGDAGVSTGGGDAGVSTSATEGGG